MNPESVIADILKSLVESAAKEVGGDSVGWLLSLVGVKQDDPNFSKMESDLANLQSQIAEVKAELDQVTDMLNQVLAEIDWDMLIGNVDGPVNDITTHFKTLQAIQANDTTTAAELQQWARDTCPSQLATISANVMNGDNGLNPKKPGLLAMYAQANAKAGVQDPAYARGSVGAGSCLDTYYSQIEQYFLYLVGVQLKAITLVVNGYNASGENNLAQSALDDFVVDLDKQCQTYLASVEAFAVYYAPDLSLMDMFGQKSAMDPVARADKTVDTVMNRVTFYARFWMGSGETPSSPYKSFSTVGVTSFHTFPSTPMTKDKGTLPILYGASHHEIPPDCLPGDDTKTPVSVYTIFPTRSGCQWTMIRCAWTNPPDDTYTINVSSGQITTLFIDKYAIANTLVVPSSGRYYYNPATKFTFNKQTPANSMSAVYTARTSFWGYQNGVYAGNTSNRYDPGRGDFSVECWFYLTDAVSSTMALVSNKSAFGGGANIDSEEPGASGFLIEITPNPDPSYKLSFTVDNGFAYYQFLASPQQLRDGRWHFLTAVRRHNKLELWLDGAQMAGSYNQSGDPSSMDLKSCFNLMFACKNGNRSPADWASFNAVEPYNGYMNDVAFWSKALSASDIKSHMTGGHGDDKSSLYAYWTFGDATLTDAVNNVKVNSGYHLAMRPAPIFYPPYVAPSKV